MGHNCGVCARLGRPAVAVLTGWLLLTVVPVADSPLHRDDPTARGAMCP